MSHVSKNKDKLLNRVKRLRGQIEAIHRSAEMIEGHILEHLVDPKLGPNTPQSLAAGELIEIVHQYLKR
jgi:DNA-binding FrmR family transcriptional regulator